MDKKLSSQISDFKFQNSFFGYDKKKVDAFVNSTIASIKKLEDEFERTLKELRDMKKYHAEFEEKRNISRERERKAFFDLENLKREIIIESNEKMEEKLKGVEEREKAHYDIIRKYKDDIQSLKKLKYSIMDQVKYLVRQQTDMLETFERIERERKKDGI
ncbi:MAG: hypothetical protein CR982_04260 [Candidatus Cloacimonadota bacterium]|nr:MAG: hypothetical protein CR982_04260 [Candidatus Cloacimonadota bacterium]PIE78493.1 MAG: hypothetical protein CSA15_07300 [Candidatus Delongbacteria bacterium]